MGSLPAVLRYQPVSSCVFTHALMLILIFCAVYPPVIVEQPMDLGVALGDTALFSAVVVGSGISYQWLVISPLGDGSALTDTTTMFHTDTVRINATSDDEGKAFYVRASNAAGDVLSTTAVLTISECFYIILKCVHLMNFSNLVHLPVIYIHPMDQFSTPHASFSVVAAGQNLSYQWLKGSHALNDNSKFSGATTATLTILSPISPYDDGFYSVMISNTAGSITSNQSLLTVCKLENILLFVVTFFGVFCV